MDGSSCIDIQTSAIKLTLVLRIGDAGFFHRWTTDSIWLEPTEPLITN